MKQVHPVFEMFYLKEREKVIRNEGFVNTVDTKQVHLVFEMFYLKEREKVIRNEGCQHCRYEAGSSGIRNVLLERERESHPE